MFSANAHLVGTGGSYFSLNRLQLFLRPEINIDDGSSEVASTWKRIQGVLAKQHPHFYFGPRQDSGHVIEILLPWTEKARQDAFFAATQTNSLDNFTSLFTDFGAFLVRPLQVDWIDLRKAIIPTMPALTEIVVFQLSSSLDVESKKAFSGAVQGFLATIRPAIAGIPAECRQALSGWIQNSLTVKLPNLARSGDSAPSQTTFDQSKGLASLFPTGAPTTMEQSLTARYTCIVSWQSASAQQHFLERIRTAPDLHQARLYGNELASFSPHVESVLVNLKLCTESGLQSQGRQWPISQRADGRLFG